MRPWLVKREELVVRSASLAFDQRRSVMGTDISTPSPFPHLPEMEYDREAWLFRTIRGGFQFYTLQFRTLSLFIRNLKKLFNLNNYYLNLVKKYVIPGENKLN